MAKQKEANKEQDMDKNQQNTDFTSKAYLQRLVNTFFRIDEIMSTITDLDHLLQLIMEESEKVVDAEASSLMLYDEEQKDLWFRIALGSGKEQLKEIRVPLGEGICGYAALKREIVNVEDAQNDPRFFKAADEKTKFITRSILAVPMIRKDRLIGILEVLNKRNEAVFTHEDEKVLEALAGLAAIAIENATLYERNLRAERMAAIGQAIAQLSHYIKNIVMALMGSISLADMQIREKRFTDLERSWMIIKRSASRVADLVQDMLSYSRERKMQLMPYDLNKLVEEVVMTAKASAQQEGVTLKLTAPQNMGRIMVDRTGIERCLFNLVNNAIDACKKVDKEEITSEESTVEKKVEVCIEEDKEKQEVYIKVQDNGEGIPSEDLPRVFNLFFSTKGAGGTGLGLAVVKKIIEEHGGRVKVESEEGQGTCFYIILPKQAINLASQK